mgnify:CR=1 FL=1
MVIGRARHVDEIHALRPGDLVRAIGKSQIRKGRARRLDSSGAGIPCVCRDEIRVLFDLIGLASQAGIELLPPFEGRKTMPLPGDDEALHLNNKGAPETESARSRDLVGALIGGLNQLKGGALRSMPQRDFWTDDMGWYGPWGIGCAEGFVEYQRFAQGPSVDSFQIGRAHV